MARYFRVAFAVSGDRLALPDTTADTSVAYDTGYSQDYQRNPVNDPLARRPERNLFNDLMFEVTDTLKELYETGTPPFITSAMNNGVAFSYPRGARVLLNSRIYESTTAGTTTTPPATGWLLVDIAGMDARYLLESNNLSDLTSAATARTNISVLSSTEADARYLLESNNLSDLTSAATARTNLGLTSAAITDIGTDSDNISLISHINALINRVNPIGSLLFWAGNTPPLGYWNLNGDTQVGARLTHTVIAAFAATNTGYISVSGDDLILLDSQFFFRGSGSSSRPVGQFNDQSHPQIETVRRVTVNGTPADGVTVVTLPRSAAISDPLAIGASGGTARYGITFQKFFPDDAVPKANTVMVCIYHGVFS